MAGEHDDEDRTLEASARALERAFEDGDIPHARDLAPVAVLCVTAAMLAATGSHMLTDGALALQQFLSALAQPQLGLPWSSVTPVALRALVVLGAAAVAAVAASLINTRGGFWPEKVAPDLTRVFSAGRVGKMFKLDAYVDLLLALFKVSVVCGASWAAWSSAAQQIPSLVLMAPSVAFATGAALVGQLLTACLVAVASGAALEAGITQWRYLQRHKMTRDAQKREHKEEEGDPLIKSRRRARARELVKNRVRLLVPKADVVVVNPTHVAVALAYKKGTDRAPRVVAKGKGSLAAVIRELAREHGIAVVEDVPLARLLYKKVKVGREVPADTYRAVATLLAFVFRATHPARPAPVSKPLGGGR